MNLSKLQSEAVKELQNYECTGRYCNHETSDKHYIIGEEFLTDQIQKAVEETLDLIATDQGWEESRDIYADALGLPLKYPKLMEDYKKRNHIKGNIVLDCQKLSIQPKTKIK